MALPDTTATLQIFRGGRTREKNLKLPTSSASRNASWGEEPKMHGAYPVTRTEHQLMFSLGEPTTHATWTVYSI